MLEPIVRWRNSPGAGGAVFAREIGPSLRPEDEGKFVAVDIGTGEYEVDADDYQAVTRLRSRLPSAEVWLERVGQPTAYQMRGGR